MEEHPKLRLRQQPILHHLKLLRRVPMEKEAAVVVFQQSLQIAGQRREVTADEQEPTGRTEEAVDGPACRICSWARKPNAWFSSRPSQ